MRSRDQGGLFLIPQPPSSLHSLFPIVTFIFLHQPPLGCSAFYNAIPKYSFLFMSNTFFQFIFLHPPLMSFARKFHPFPFLPMRRKYDETP